MTKLPPCNDYGDNPACLGESDPRYTMDYRDVDPNDGFIYWCAHCGPNAHEMKKAIEGRLDEDPGFADELRAAIEKAEAEFAGTKN